MTLSGKSDRQLRVEAARAARKDRAENSAAKRPWLLPAIVTITVAVLVGALIFALVSGIGFF
ncbi:MAG: hypothetical protein ABI566_06200 [Pseudolysinimonas sp.]